MELTQLISAPYTPSAQGGLRYDDLRPGIAWPPPVATLSERGGRWPLLRHGDAPASQDRGTATPA